MRKLILAMLQTLIFYSSSFFDLDYYMLITQNPECNVLLSNFRSDLVAFYMIYDVII